MSTATPDRSYVSGLAVQPVSQGKVITSEWFKLTTLRSSWITMVLGIGSLAFLGGVIGFFTNREWDRMRPARQAAFDAVGSTRWGSSRRTGHRRPRGAVRHR